MKHELGEILALLRQVPMSDSAEDAPLCRAHGKLFALHQSLPDEPLTGVAMNRSVSDATYDLQQAKLATIQQLLTESIDLRIKTVDDAKNLVGMVNAAYGEILTPKQHDGSESPSDDIDTENADFSQALKWMKADKKVARRGWKLGRYAVLRTEYHHLNSGTDSTLKFSSRCNNVQSDFAPDEQDILATDWYLVR